MSLLSPWNEVRQSYLELLKTFWRCVSYKNLPNNHIFKVLKCLEKVFNSFWNQGCLFPGSLLVQYLIRSSLEADLHWSLTFLVLEEFTIQSIFNRKIFRCISWYPVYTEPSFSSGWCNFLNEQNTMFWHIVLPSWIKHVWRGGEGLNYFQQ